MSKNRSVRKNLQKNMLNLYFSCISGVWQGNLFRRNSTISSLKTALFLSSQHDKILSYKNKMTLFLSIRFDKKKHEAGSLEHYRRKHLLFFQTVVERKMEQNVRIFGQLLSNWFSRQMKFHHTERLNSLGKALKCLSILLFSE